jgi:phosphoribosylformimino-5-aminoimidazole carboxamide ribotide isomerase
MYLDMGVAKVILGTEATRNPQLVKETCKAHPGRIIVGIDARRGKVAIDGWTKTTSLNSVELAKWYEDCGVAAVIFTDIQRDGMQTGPNVEETRRLAEAVSIPVIASGGVSSLEDLKRLVPLQKFGVEGVISGRALYSGAIQFQEALSLLKSE